MRDFELTMRFDGIVFNCHGVVQLVRCKDCKYRKMEDPGMVYCESVIGGWTPNDWYCADGEREDNEIN